MSAYFWFGGAAEAGLLASPAVPALVVDTQPASTTAPSAVMSPVVVRMTTDGSTTDTSFTGDITLAWSPANAYGSLGGTVTVAAVAGIATFSNLIPSNHQGGAFTLTASASGVADVTTTEFYVVGAELQSLQDFVDDNGGNSVFPEVYDLRFNVDVVGGAASGVRDALGGLGGRTPGRTFAQATSGNRPTVNGTVGQDSSLTLDGTDDFMTTTGAALTKLIGSAAAPNPVHVFAVMKATGDGPLAGIAADETSATTYPFMMIRPQGGFWQGTIASDGAGVGGSGNKWAGAFTPAPGYARDANRRLVWIGKNGWHTDATDSNVGAVYKFGIAGVPVARHGRVFDATNANTKLVLGRLGATYGAGEICALLVYTGEPDNTFLNALTAWAESQFGALAEQSTNPTVVFSGNSLVQGNSGSDDLLATLATGTTTWAYVAANRNTGSRGTLLAQMPLMKEIHQYNVGRNGDQFPKMLDWFDRDISVYKDAARTGPVIVVVNEVLNTLNTVGLGIDTLAELLDVVDDYHAACQAVGIKFVMCTVPDAKIWYVGGATASTGGFSAIGQIASDFNDELRANPTAHCDYVLDLAAVGGLFEVGVLADKRCFNATYYNDPATDGGHLTTTGYNEAGIVIKDWFDANEGVLWPTNARGAARRHYSRWPSAA
jgi:hypothetical protein